MIYQLTKESYKLGCNKGLDKLDSVGILDKVNAITEWDGIVYPVIQEDITIEVPEYDENSNLTGNNINKEITVSKEDKNFLKKKQLEPGAVIVVNGNVIAFDGPDRIVLVFAKGKGYNALERFVNEIVEPEYAQAFEYEPATELVWESLDIIPSEYDCVKTVAYPTYKIWKDIFVKGRDISKTMDSGSIAVKVTATTDHYPLPVTLIFTDWEVLYSSKNFDEDDNFLLDILIENILSSFYEDTTRIYNPLRPLSVEEQVSKYKEEWKESKGLIEVEKDDQD